MMIMLRDLLLPQPKSKIKARDGLASGKYKFFTSSPIQSKYYNEFVYDQPALIFGTGGNASVHYCTDAFATSTDCLVMFGTANTNLELIYHYLSNNLHLLQAGFKGAGLQHISKDYILNIIIDLPDIETQSLISTQVNKIDCIIEFRKKQIQQLDHVVKSRFIEMFGEGKYSVCKWNEVFKTRTGKLDSNAMVKGGKYPFFTCSKETYTINEYAFDQEALLLAGNNAAGKYDVKYYRGKFNAYQRTYVLTLKNDWQYLFFKHQLDDKLTYLKELSKGSNTRYVTLKILADLEFIVPPVALQNQFADFVNQVDKSKYAIFSTQDVIYTKKQYLTSDIWGIGDAHV